MTLNVLDPIEREIVSARVSLEAGETFTGQELRERSDDLFLCGFAMGIWSAHVHRLALRVILRKEADIRGMVNELARDSLSEQVESMRLLSQPQDLDERPAE